MSFLNKFKKLFSIWFAVVFTLVGLIISSVAAVFFFQPEKETASVNATITKIDVIEMKTGEETNQEYHVFVSYEINGKSYNSELGAYQSNWSVGDVIECKYDIDDPKNISYGNGKLTVLIVFLVGVAAFAFGIISLVESIKKPSSEYAQYNRIDENNIDPAKRAEIENNTEALQEYVFHFTGKMNQSYVMKDKFGKEVFQAECGGITLIKDTDFDFMNLQTGNKTLRKIGHSVTTTTGNGALLFPSVSSSFKIDGKNCWDFLAESGYGFEFSLSGIKCHYEVKHYGVPVGSIETAGTELVKEKYVGNPLAKLPTNGIYKIFCKPSEIEGFFYICFCITKTDATLN